MRERAARLRHLLHAVGRSATRVRLERVGHDAAHERHELLQVVRRRVRERAAADAAAAAARVRRSRRRRRLFCHRRRVVLLRAHEASRCFRRLGRIFHAT